MYKRQNVDFGSKKVEVLIDMGSLKNVHMGLEKVVEVLDEKGLSAKKKGDSSIVFDLGESDFKTIFKFKQRVKDTIISGVKGIENVLVVKRDANYVVLTAGTNLKDILLFKGVNPEKVSTNDLHEIASLLGIEAARQAIINEINKVLVSQGLDINQSHLQLVSDAMTSSGIVKGVTRVGIISDKSSVLARASFETPVKHFVNASRTGKKDKMASVIENIILNQPVPVGTGLPGLLVKVTGPLSEQKTTKKK